MRNLALFFSFLLLPLTSIAQVPPSADSLANWQPPSDVRTYIDGTDTLHVLGDSTWVALQEEVTIGCRLGPDGSFWITKPFPVTRDWVTQADTTLRYKDLQATYECIHYVQILLRKQSGLLE